MRLRLCGTRGSTPAPGVPYTRYGGQTSCVAVIADDDECRLVLDAGTGLRRLPEATRGKPFRGSMLLTHLHWDHTHGLPFSPATDSDGAQTSLLMPAQPGDAEDILARAMSPPHFPIRPGELRGAWAFNMLSPGRHVIEGFDVLALEIPHKGGVTFGYRIADGRTSIAYMPDHAAIALGPGSEGFGPYHDAALQLADGVDVLLHDSQYTREEFPARSTFGHSTIDYAVGLGGAAGARHVMLFHHDPQRSDDELDAILAGWSHNAVPVSAAVEGSLVDALQPDPAVS